MFWENGVQDRELDAALMLKILEQCPSMDRDVFDMIHHDFRVLYAEYKNKDSKEGGKPMDEFEPDFNELFSKALRENKYVGPRFVDHVKRELAHQPKFGQLLEELLDSEGKFSGSADKERFHRLASSYECLQNKMRSQGKHYDPIGIMLMKSGNWEITSRHIAMVVSRYDLALKLDRYLPGAKRKGFKSTVRKSPVSERTGWRKYLPRDTGLAQLATGKGLAYAATIIFGVYSLGSIAFNGGNANETPKELKATHEISWGTNGGREEAIDIAFGLYEEAKNLEGKDKEKALQKLDTLEKFLTNVDARDVTFRLNDKKRYGRIEEIRKQYQELRKEL